MKNEPSIELSYQEIKHVSNALGFKFTNEQRIRCGYTRHEKSMLNYVYDCVFFVAEKQGEE
jgi:hypothetical protein